ncbi:MAG: hypothetical protein K0U39_05515 [Alphaproteobacteria bacterium]|nr:hypothetical protein [Alphaproteobacteria bacterium]
MRYHIVFTVFFIHLFFLMNIYIEDELSAPENYVTCSFLDISTESLECHQQYVAQSKQFLHYITQRDRLYEPSRHETIKLTKIGVRADELRLEHVKLHLRLQEIDGKIAQITKKTSPRAISALYRQRKHIMIQIDNYFDRFDRLHKESDAFFATISYD